MVFEENIPTYSSAQFIGIKYTTAKDIVRKHRKEKKGKIRGALSPRSGQKKNKATDNPALAQQDSENRREEEVRVEAREEGPAVKEATALSGSILA